MSGPRHRPLRRALPRPRTLGAPPLPGANGEAVIEIRLTQGKVAVLDDEDADLAAHAWYANHIGGRWYALRRDREDGRVRTPLLHREVWARAHPGEPLPPEVDHRNGDGLDCRRENLRAATHADNGRNAPKRAHNTSGFKGVRRRARRWASYIRVAGRFHHLGYHDTPEAAARAYDDAARRYFGAFACVNFPGSGERQA